MKEQYIKKEDFKTTDWEGGQTTELYIYPQGSSLENRDFDFRISSASFTGTESVFSDFTGYRRYITPLEGHLYLDHDKLYKRKLQPYEIESFRGFWKTRSQNSLDCIDYNYIVKEDARALIYILEPGSEFQLRPGLILTIFSLGDLDFFIDGQKRSLQGGDLFVVETEDEEVLRIDKAKDKIIATMYIKAHKH